MGFNFRNILSSFILALFLLPAIALANTDFKGKETVNINRATAATLAAYLKGVGANKAKAIVDYRKANGKFKNISDLNNVPGIGEETYKDIKKNVSTSRGKSAAPEGYNMADTSGKTRSSKKKASSKSKKKSTTSKSSDSSSTRSSSSSKSKSSKSSSSSKASKSDKASKSAKSTKKSKTTKAKSKSKPKSKSKKSSSKAKKSSKKKPAKKKSSKKKKSS